MMKMLMKNLSVLAVLLVATSAFAQDKVALKTKLPPPLFVGD
jgi:hypothetical protein